MNPFLLNVLIIAKALAEGRTEYTDKEIQELSIAYSDPNENGQ